MEEGYRPMTREDMVEGVEFEECQHNCGNEPESHMDWMEVMGGGWGTSIYPKSFRVGNMNKLPEGAIDIVLKNCRIKINYEHNIIKR